MCFRPFGDSAQTARFRMLPPHAPTTPRPAGFRRKNGDDRCSPNAGPGDDEVEHAKDQGPCETVLRWTEGDEAAPHVGRATDHGSLN